eukprot:gene14016-18797_t
MRKRSANKEVNLDDMVRSGPQSAYEALQLYRSKAIRMKTKNPNETIAALQVLASGTVCLLENNYENAGAELSNVFLEFLVEFNSNINNQEIRQLVYSIDDRFPSKSSYRVEYLKGCVKWTSSNSNVSELGDRSLQTRLGECLWDMNANDKSAVTHFVAGEAPGLFLSKIYDSYPETDSASQLSREKALTVGIVTFLSFENLRDANELKSQYFKKYSITPATINDSPLLSFCSYLLQTCQRDAAPLFKQLVNTYAEQLDFDESVPQLLMGPIALKFFDIRPKVNPMMSMLQSMLS